VRLLADLRQVFQAAEAEALYTSTILAALHRLEDAPWADWYGHPLTTRELAKLLRPYQVESKNLREQGTGQPRKGYARADLHDAWARYVPLHPLHPLQASEPAGQPGNRHVADLLPPSATSATSPGPVADVAEPPHPLRYRADLRCSPCSGCSGTPRRQRQRLALRPAPHPLRGLRHRHQQPRPLRPAPPPHLRHRRPPPWLRSMAAQGSARLSRYPTRTPPAASGHVEIRARAAAAGWRPLTTDSRPVADPHPQPAWPTSQHLNTTTGPVRSPLI
jgi:hypothetical protein